MLISMSVVSPGTSQLLSVSRNACNCCNGVGLPVSDVNTLLSLPLRRMYLTTQYFGLRNHPSATIAPWKCMPLGIDAAAAAVFAPTSPVTGADLPGKPPATWLRR